MPMLDLLAIGDGEKSLIAKERVLSMETLVSMDMPNHNKWSHSCEMYLL